MENKERRLKRLVQDETISSPLLVDLRIEAKRGAIRSGEKELERLRKELELLVREKEKICKST